MMWTLVWVNYRENTILSKLIMNVEVCVGSGKGGGVGGAYVGDLTAISFPRWDIWPFN